jgi:hypothetical protein
MKQQIIDSARRKTSRTGRRLGDRGGNLIEAAIVTPLLVLLTFSIVDFASLFYVYLALESGVSRATRFAVTGNTLDDPDHPGNALSRRDSIIAAMRNATPTLTLPADAFSFSHLPPGAGAWITGPGGPTDIEKLTVRYAWTPLTPILRPFFSNGQLTLVVDSAMKNEGRFE